MDLFEMLLIGGAYALSLNALMSSRSQYPLVSPNQKQVESPVKEDPTSLTEDEKSRIHALRSIIYSNDEIGVSNDEMIVKTKRNGHDMMYYFHFLNRPNPFIVLRYDERKQKVEEMLLNNLDPSKKEVIKNMELLKRKIIEKHQSSTFSIRDEVEEKANSLQIRALYLLQKYDGAKQDEIKAQIEEPLRISLKNYLRLSEHAKNEIQSAFSDLLGFFEEKIQAYESE